jgi:hypothetical protein
MLDALLFSSHASEAQRGRWHGEAMTEGASVGGHSITVCPALSTALAPSVTARRYALRRATSPATASHGRRKTL